MNPISALLAALGGLTVVFVGGWTRAVMAARRLPDGAASPATDGRFPTGLQVGIGALTNFFDTLGIGSFATTTAIFRLRQLVPDRIIPGTLNAGHTLPTIAQAFIYISVIPVDVLTLFSMITAAVLGAWLGAGVVVALVEADGAARDGRRAAGRGDADADHPAPGAHRESDPAARRRGTRRQRSAADRRGGRQLPARRPDDPRHRPLRAVHDPHQPARHESRHRLPDHDGLVRVPDAGRQPALHPRALATASATRSAWPSAAFPACSSPPTSSSRCRSGSCAGW